MLYELNTEKHLGLDELGKVEATDEMLTFWFGKERHTMAITSEIRAFIKHVYAV